LKYGSKCNREGTHNPDGFDSASVLVFDDNGQGYDNMERLISKTGIANVFFLTGGIEGYRSFLEQQVTLLQAKDYSKKTLRKCASCP
jgi:hypothetical protein